MTSPTLWDSLDDPDRTARRCDPITSHGKREWLGAVALGVLRAFIAAGGEGTANDVARAMARDAAREGREPMDRGCVSRRFTSLRRYGLIAETGELRDGGRGKECRVFRVADAGREAAR